MSAFGCHFDTTAWLSNVEATKAEINAAGRPAAQAGVQVLYEAVKANAQRITPKTGKLAASIYQVYSRDQSQNGRQVYHVSWNARKAPHGHLVEYGHLQRYATVIDEETGRYFTFKKRPLAQPRQVAARPFVRPAMAQFPQALEAAEAKFFEELAAKGVVK